MTAGPRDLRANSSLSSWARHPVAIPVGAALLAVALLGSVGWVAAQEASRTVQGDAQGRVRSNRDAAVRALVHQANDLKLTVATWAANPPVIDSLNTPTPTSLRAAQSELSTLARSKDSPATVITDLRGRIVALYPSQPELIGKDFSYRDWFQGASLTGKPYVSEAYRTAATGHPLVVGVAAPVLEGSRRIGYITLLWQLASVQEVSLGSRADDGVTITVTDQKGQSLTGALRVDARGQVIESPVTETTRQALAGRSVSTVNSETLLAAGPVPGLGWTVTAELPSSIALAPARAFQRSLTASLGLALLVLLFFTLLTLRFARRSAAEESATRAAATTVRASEDRFRRVFNEALIGKLLVSKGGEIIQCNATLSKMVGCEPREFIGKPVETLFVDPSDRELIRDLIEVGDGKIRTEMALRDKAERPLWALVALSWMRELDGERVLLAQIEDITARRAAEHRLTEQALHDELTGLPNRRLLFERFEHAFALAKTGTSTSIAALFIDLDGFKPINDSAGHDAGDQVLIAVADDLRSVLRSSDTVARIGGDEFVVLLQQDHGLAYVRAVADRIITTIRRQVTTDTGSLTLSASVGFARVDLDHEPDVSPDELMRRADAAMYRAKEGGRDRYDGLDTDLSEINGPAQVTVPATHDGIPQPV